MATKYTLKREAEPASFKVDYRKELNEEQLKVVQAGDGPVLVLAGAGSGKTRTIVYRVAYLLERGVKPDEILLVTFTNKAAKEMLFRTEALLGSFPNGLWGGTFHHVANLLLRRFGQAIGYPANFTILDQEDSRSLLSVCVKEANIDTKQRRFPAPAVLEDIISLSVSTLQPIRSIVEELHPSFINIRPAIEEVAQRYSKRKKSNHLVDFDDLLVLLDRLLTEHLDIRERISRQFRFVLVDEYQDTNMLQDSIVKKLSSVHQNLLVVGDDSQSIYSFRGATVRNILDFPKAFPKCQMFRLESNYRSTSPILDLANAVIRHNPERFDKTLRPVRKGGVKPILVPTSSVEQEAAFVSQRVLELRDQGVSLNEIAVLFRATYQSQALEFELTRRDIPYEYRGGVRFFERAHIKDVLAYLKLVDNPRDEVAGLRVLQLESGIGLETALKIWRFWLKQASSAQALAEFDFSSILTERPKLGLRNFQAKLHSLIKYPEAKPSELVGALTVSDYRDYLEATYPNASERISDLEELARFSQRYRKLSSFLSEVSLQESFSVEAGEQPSTDDESMVLTTIHQAKGLEWEAVFVIGCNDGAFPNPRSALSEDGLAEERRLFYVAATRAKTHLHISYSIGVNLRLTSMRLLRPSPLVTELPRHLFEELSLEEETIEPADDVLIERDEQGEPKSLLDRVISHSPRRKTSQRRILKKL